MVTLLLWIRFDLVKHLPLGLRWFSLDLLLDLREFVLILSSLFFHRMKQFSEVITIILFTIAYLISLLMKITFQESLPKFRR